MSKPNNQTLHESTRFLDLKDLFTITCKKCGSTDVDLHAEECDECGPTVTAECNQCGNKYDYHDFKQIKVWYDEKGKEVKCGEIIITKKEE